MGFGSYDESEQENQDSDNDLDEEDAVNVHESTHDGEVNVETDADSEELIDQLQDMKSEDDDA